MTKLLAVLLVLMAIVAGWLYVRTMRVTPEWQKPKIGKVDRGSIRVPITASGLVRPLKEIGVKSKASGEVIRIPVVEGDAVKVGDVLLELKRDDEQRSVDRARAAHDRVKAGLELARVQVEQARQSVEIANARVDELEAQLYVTQADLDELKRMSATAASEQDIRNGEARLRVNQAQVQAAKAQAVNSQNGIKEAEANVRIAEANLAQAQKELEDAEERLRETTITSKHDAIVTDVLVTEGMLVQSGTGGFTGGTLLMTLADLSQLKVIARVNEADYGAIVDISPIDALPMVEKLREAAARNAEQMAKRSGEVRITVDAFRDEVFTGRIMRVEPQGQLNVGAAIIQFDVHVEIDDEKRYLLPLGTQTQVEFTVQSAQDVLRVPAESVKTWQDQKGIWLKVAPDSGSSDAWGKRFVPCRFGISDGEYTEVIETIGGTPLLPGDEVYTKPPLSDQERR
ncbi:MAG: biotin/lipoyl-binding protein [Phycisphaerae bacterium]|nr:biotin/lipoyl-binding protein [Phycisphaerae bacterium]MCZ2400977.1 biotin/lipoyl-binding protein [Phycisphaerae bacterium]NUQ48614.1 biotin/lipoyl-binding protein [Phycisphaerae bacterium]